MNSTDIKKRLFEIVSFSFFLLLLSCTISTLHLDITAAHQLNRGTNYHALPVVVRIYTLKNPEGFSDATFRELWHSDKTLLGENLISRHEVILVPGKTVHLSLAKNNDADYLGAVALFRHPSHNTWRAIIPMPLFSASLTLAGNRLVLH